MAHRNVANGTGPRRQRRRGGTRSGWAAAGATIAVASGLVAASLLTPTSAGAGGGDWLFPLRDRYEPADVVTLVGYTVPYAYRWGADQETDRDWRSRGPFYAYLRNPADVTEQVVTQERTHPFVSPTDLRMGELTVEDRPGPYPGGSVRAEVRFTLPDGLAAGRYEIVVCDDPCTIGLGELVESSVYVGVDPPQPIVRNWPLDDPAIDELADGALLRDLYSDADGDTIDDWTVTAAEVRAGYQPTRPPVVAVESPAPGDPSPPVRTVVDTDRGLSGEVIAWLAGLGMLLVLWCAAWRLRPGGGRIVGRPTDDPRRPPFDAADDPEPVRIEL